MTARAIERVGDAWTVLVLRAAFMGERRFGQLQAAVGAPKAVLTDRLMRLTSDGLLDRVPYETKPPRHEYRLTPMARDLYPVILLLLQWSEQWYPAPGPTKFTLWHQPCGRKLTAALVCGACETTVTARMMRMEVRTGRLLGVASGRARPRRNADAAVLDRAGAGPLGRALAIIGDQWTFLILRDAFSGIKRFDDFIESTGISRNILADRLSKLVANGIFDRTQYQDRPLRLQYALTDKGFALYPASAALKDWGDRWLSDAAGPPTRLVHRIGDHVFEPKVVCTNCRRAVTTADVAIVRAQTVAA